MRLLPLIALASCTKAGPSQDPPPAPPPADAAVIDKPGPRLLDAATPALDAAPDAGLSHEIRPVEMAGPYPSVAASCQAARPCGFTAMDATGNETDPPTTPDCSAVENRSVGPMQGTPASIAPSGTTQTWRLVPDGEIRISSVTCAIPKGARGDFSEYYIFVQRKDGWWRTRLPLFAYSFNEKYCSGSMYVLWNIKPQRTIMGIAAGHACLGCMKQGNHEEVTELMVRVETTGTKPIVFQPLAVGTRSLVTIEATAVDPSDPSCKPGASANSMTETWVSDDEVILAGKGGTTGALATPFNLIDVYVPAAAGRYKFVR